MQPIPADPQNTEAVYAVYPLAKYPGGETAYITVTSSELVGDTCIFPCDSEGVLITFYLLACIPVLDHARALRSAGWEPEEVRGHVA
ncbi:hypothetical protein [Nocardia sp. NPDC057440]|uniref:hypothetical protein n=1 Tax=Nocardia sp. NPDC057440 TaxID=3346134 RepID=UPI00366ECC2C